MSKKTLNTIIKMLLGVTILWISLSIMDSRKETSRSPTNSVKDAFTGLDSTTITGFMIKSPDGSVTELSNAGDGWKVNGYLVDETSLSKFWNAIGENQVGNVVANNAGNHGRLGLAEDSTWMVEIMAPDSQQPRILVGNSGPTYPSVFTRLSDKDEVVVVSGDLRGAVTQNLTEWRNKTIITTDTSAVKSILLEYDDETYLLQRLDTTWTVDGQAADAAALIGITAELSHMEASGFLDVGNSPSDQNQRSIIAMDDSGNILNQLVLSGEGSTRHVQNPKTEVVFEIPSWKFDRIVPESFMFIQDDDVDPVRQ